VGIAGSDGGFAFLVGCTYYFMAVPSELWAVVSWTLPGNIYRVLFDEIYRAGDTFR
jgi:uncharacterized membrane protein